MLIMVFPYEDDDGGSNTNLFDASFKIGNLLFPKYLGGTLTEVRIQNQWCPNSASFVEMTIGGPLHRYSLFSLKI